MAFNNLGAAMREAGVEHRRTVTIRETLADTAAKAKSAKMRAVRRGAAISLRERERRARDGDGVAGGEEGDAERAVMWPAERTLLVEAREQKKRVVD